ncbi:3'-5' exonuclease [Thiomicrospira sp. S5]|uniref:3'-5' exonuclease n=1 Tax=Thiomicrospira sp. S5 TaxID=1803865 RepID=UPI0004A7341B|nr:3'-5' exonuclease [Thiomicrospira sp. S5]AZR82183.1 DNA polymerase III subunit epsilon [Thiomicrospira sp. S5]
MWRSLRRRWHRRQLKDERFAFLFDAVPPENEWVCFDCETTGLDPKKDKIVSLSAMKIRGQEILTSEALNLTLAQDAAISEQSIKVHWIRNEDTVHGLSEREAIEQFLHFIGSRPLVGYYLEFDVAMVNQVLKPWLGIGLPNPQIEVSALYYDYKEDPIPKKVIDLSFDAILKELALPNFGQHDAFSDALMTALIFIKLKKLG